MDATDEELFSKGNEAAMTVLVRRYEQPLFRFLFSRTRDAHLAEDIFQETFLRLHRSRGSFRAGSPLKPYLYQIALNLARDARARIRNRPPAASIEDPPTAQEEPRAEAPSPAETAAAREAGVRIRNAMEDLPDAERTVVDLRVFVGLSFPEIAEMTGAPIPTAKSRMLYALRRLRPALEACFEPGGFP